MKKTAVRITIVKNYKNWNKLKLVIIEGWFLNQK